MNYEKLSRKALGCMYTATFLGTCICAAILGAILYYFIFPNDITIGKYIIYVIFALMVLNTFISPLFRFHRYGYLITSDYIEVKEGYLNVTRSIVPMERLHKIQTTRGPIDHIFGVTKVIVTTAGGDVTIRFLEEEKAAQIAQTLTKRINHIAASGKEAVNLHE